VQECVPNRLISISAYRRIKPDPHPKTQHPLVDSFPTDSAVVARDGSSAITFGYDGWKSTVIIRGRGRPRDCKAFWKKCLAAGASRSAENQKSTVAPLESTARYRYRQFPPWQIYVSSILQEPLVGFNLVGISSSALLRSAVPSAKWWCGRPADHVLRAIPRRLDTKARTARTNGPHKQ
jgi:hypothetical protein